MLSLSCGFATTPRSAVGNELLTTLRLRIASHPTDTLRKGELLQWTNELSMAVPSVSSAASAASPLERSLLVGAAVGATTPLFMLLPCSISLVPVAMWAGAPGVSAALDLILPGLLNTPIALANFTGATAIALCREGWLHLRRVPLTTALHRHGMLIGGAAGTYAPALNPSSRPSHCTRTGCSLEARPVNTVSDISILTTPGPYMQVHSRRSSLWGGQAPSSQRACSSP